MQTRLLKVAALVLGTVASGTWSSQAHAQACGAGFVLNPMGMCVAAAGGGVSATTAAVGTLQTSASLSTSEVLKVVQQRKDELSGACPPGLVRRNGQCVTPQASAGQSASAPRRETPSSLVSSTTNGLGVWATGYGDYEHQSNISPGQAVNPTRTRATGGFLVGTDISRRNVFAPGDLFIIGALAGYNHTRSTFSDGVAAQTQAGGMLGAYLGYVAGRVALDLTAKYDFFDFEPGIGVPSGITSIGLVNSSYALNVNYRIWSAGNQWLEPTAGIRYSRTDMGTEASQFGFSDGDVLRLQSGLRYGLGERTSYGFLTTTMTGLLYSDVAINGFSAPVNTAAPISKVDEGKVRVQGILRSKLDYGNGFSNFGEVDMRGCDDYFAIGGKIGLRYEW